MQRVISFLVFFVFAMSTYAQSITFNDCNGREIVFALDAANSPDITGRNVYISGMLEFRFNATLSRWELKAIGMGGFVNYYAVSSSSPNPPNSDSVDWVGERCSPDETIVTGSGTQADPCPGDNENPVVSCRNLMYIISGDNMIFINVDSILQDSSDNCAIFQLEISQDTFTVDDIGENLVVLTATDFSGNTSTCVATVNLTLAAPIPSLSQWALIILALSLTLFGLVYAKNAVKQKS